MAAGFSDLVRNAARKARQFAEGFPGNVAGKDLPWRVIEGYDADVRPHIERDRRTEDERDRVLIAAVKLAELPATAGAEQFDGGRRHLIDAIDYLEQAVLRFGIVNRAAAKQGHGQAGDRVSRER